MLAARRTFRIGEEIVRTPLLVPSYSSRAGGQAVSEIIKVTKEFVGGHVLVSAYDVARHRVRQSSLSFATHVFLDSGGYEAGGDADLSEVVSYARPAEPWSIEEHEAVLGSWDFRRPTVLVNYDSPRRRETLDRQIRRAKKMKRDYPSAAHVFLVKPEPRQAYLNVAKILDRLRDLEEFWPAPGFVDTHLS